MGLKTVRFSTSTMHCSSCAMLIEMELGDLAGVTAVSADHADGLTSVEYDDETLTAEQIAGAIRALGHEAEPVE